MGFFVLVADVLRRILDGLISELNRLFDRFLTNLLSFLDSDLFSEVAIRMDDLDKEDDQEEQREESVEAAILAIGRVDLVLGGDLLAQDICLVHLLCQLSLLLSVHTFPVWVCCATWFAYLLLSFALS